MIRYEYQNIIHGFPWPIYGDSCLSCITTNLYSWIHGSMVPDRKAHIQPIYIYIYIYMYIYIHIYIYKHEYWELEETGKQKLSKWQLSVQPVTEISSRWQHFRFNVRYKCREEVRSISLKSSRTMCCIFYPCPNLRTMIPLQGPPLKVLTNCR